jgi:SAM-dependent methyltransferase
VTDFAQEASREFYAQTYDACVSDWPHEIEFYERLAAETHLRGQAILELACGTGRVAIRLAERGASVVGLDFSSPMLAVARKKSEALPNVRWVEADMRNFRLEERFGLIIIPGHAFQNLTSPEDQIDCLSAVRRHLTREGQLVVHLDHIDVDWLGSLREGKGGVFEDAGEFDHPITGKRIRTTCAWNYEPSTQTAILQTVWEEVASDGAVTGRWETGEVRIHCLFRFEMEHALRRAGFESLDLFGDFEGGKLTDDSSEMIWIARMR